MVKNTTTKEATDVRGILFRLIVFVGLLIVISIILEGCTMKPTSAAIENVHLYNNSYINYFSYLKGVDIFLI